MIEQKHAVAERQLESKRIYEGRILNLRVDGVSLANGNTAKREVVEHKPAVAVLAENERGEILLIKQYRYATGEFVIELPAGITEPGESFSDTAVRELQEETGWKPGAVRKVSEFYSSPGFSDELIVLYFATSLTWDKLPEDDDECIHPRFVDRDNVRRMIENGAIRDCKTLFGLHWWLLNRDANGTGDI